MKNKLPDLRNHLFEQLERLSDENISNDSLEKEVFRADAMVNVSKQIIESAKVEVAFVKAVGMKKGTTDFISIDKHEALPESKKANDVGIKALK